MAISGRRPAAHGTGVSCTTTSGDPWEWQSAHVPSTVAMRGSRLTQLHPVLLTALTTALGVVSPRPAPALHGGGPGWSGIGCNRIHAGGIGWAEAQP